MRLICWESALLGLAGGILGCFAGWVAVQVMNATFPTKLHLYASPGLLLFSLTFSTILGMIGGLYPAIWALRMSPMEAIRRG
jgi:putative ABC transport system permease protein